MARIIYSLAQLAALTLPEDEREGISVNPNQAFTELNENIIKKFSCDDLNTIDKLWLEHSGCLRIGKEDN